MNVETTEIKAVEQVATTDEALDILALSFDDLDMVSGGTAIGSAY
ncbi:MAG TPA: hypothetical protein VMK32_14150 [Burkholderiaceae bacterium]|nr:hypothetical protein [Burkholderiaceae bacterium]